MQHDFTKLGNIIFNMQDLHHCISWKGLLIYRHINIPVATGKTTLNYNNHPDSYRDNQYNQYNQYNYYNQYNQHEISFL